MNTFHPTQTNTNSPTTNQPTTTTQQQPTIEPTTTNHRPSTLPQTDPYQIANENRPPITSQYQPTN
jgi:hypothetical protein